MKQEYIMVSRNLLHLKLNNSKYFLAKLYIYMYIYIHAPHFDFHLVLNLLFSNNLGFF